MNLPIYHETRSAVYYDNGDGSLSVLHKGNRKRGGVTLFYLKNDEQGMKFYKNYRKKNGTRIRINYRCPNNGMTYDEVCKSHYRRGNISKKFALVMNVADNSPYVSPYMYP